MAFASAPLSSSAFFTPSLFAFDNASKALADSTLKLSTGSRISRAGDDVAAFSVAARMQSQLVALKAASNNAVQGDSLLQVAQGGLEQILALLENMDALAAQSNSGSISAVDRTYLQAEFAGYLEEIDRIAGSTSFNNITLLNGNLSGDAEPTTATTASTKATGQLAFNANPTAGQTVVINGVTFTANTDFTIGGSTAATVESLKDALNNSTNTAISKATYTRSGDSLIITADAGGSLGNNFTIDRATSTTNFTTTGDATQAANIFTLTGGADTGLGVGSTVATGTIGNTLVTAQNQSKASVTLNITGTISNGELLRIDNGNGGFLDFTFATTASADTDIQIGATTEETLQNAIDTITQYDGTSNFVTRQLEFQVSGDSLVIRNKTFGNPGDFNGAVPDIAETLANGSLSAATITGGTKAGIDTSGVTNADFIGSLEGGFTATYNSADNVTASLTVGSSTYTAEIADTTVGSNTTVRFTSTDGGYFDVELASGQGETVADQDDADIFAARLTDAIDDLTFSQNRPITNLQTGGDFIGATASLQLSDFSEVRIDDIEVTAPVGDDATIDITVNGEVFRASTGIGEQLGAGETLTFTSLTNANNKLTLTNGTTAQDFSDADNAQTVEDGLRELFGLNVDGSGVTFQVGTSPSDRVQVVVSNSTTDRIFNGNTPDISTQSNAADAQDAIATARNSVLTTLSKVGALQARFQSAQEVNTKVIEGVTGARSILADTDIAEESTNYALAALKVNSGVAVIAQTRQLQSSMLTLLQAGLE